MRLSLLMEDSNNKNFASTQFDMPSHVSSEILRFARTIDPNDLTEEDGIEHNSHVTIKYGIHTHNANDIRDVISGFGPVEIQLGSTSLFQSDENDVLKIDVSGDLLHELNELIASRVECTDTHPNYVPHVTIAYLKPGAGSKYIDNDFSHLGTLSLGNVIFSVKDGRGGYNRTLIKICDIVTDDDNRCWVYKCPHCSCDAYNGDYKSGSLYRGGAKCSSCGESFSAIKLEPISKDGPVLHLDKEYDYSGINR